MLNTSPYALLSCVCICLAIFPSICSGQSTPAGLPRSVPNPLASGSTQVASPLPRDATAVAVSGNPYGVASIVIPISPRESSSAAIPVRVVDTQSRTLYPAAREVTEVARTGPPLVDIAPGRGIGRGRLLGRITNIIRTVTSEEVDQVVAIEVAFLFRGTAPLNVIVETDRRYQVDLIPTRLESIRAPRNALPPQFQQHLGNWWELFTESAERSIASGDYAPVVETYLVATLARRLQLPLPEFLSQTTEDDEQSIASTLALVFGAESLRNEAFTRVATGNTNLMAAANRPVPPGPQWQDRESTAPDSEIPSAESSPGDPTQLPESDIIEPLAQYVPANAFYLRFGSFQNYLWFRKLGEQFGGDLTRMITIRGFDYEVNQRTESLLHLPSSELAETFGPAIIEDLAIIGHDLFLSEGPSMGVLFQARNAFLFQTALKSERQLLANSDPAVSLKSLQIEGQEVSLLSSADNRVRSFLVSRGNFFLVTSSATLAREFLVCDVEHPSLAHLPAFRAARRKMPNRDEYTVFAYFSEPFLQNLVSPQYQIELRRRLFACANIAALQLARLTSNNEHASGDQLDYLIANGWLPPAHGNQPDGSGLILAGDIVTDSKRGAQGSFLPISDVELAAVTTEEYDWYAKRAKFYSENWNEMDPLVVGVRSLSRGPDGTERIALHAEVAPLVPEKYGWILQQLGPPTRRAIQFSPDDIAAIQAHVVSDRLGGLVPAHHLFLAVKDDVLPNPSDLDGVLGKFRALQSLSAYLGAWPQPGVIDRLPLGLGRGQPVGPGMTRLLGGLYRYQGNGFSIISFLPEIITGSMPYLAVVEREEPAQVRFHVDNLNDTQLETWINQQLYAQTLSSSIAGARLLDSFTTQLGIPENEAKATANKILDAKLQCSMGGDYLLAQFPTGSRWWSTAVSPDASPTDVPAGFMTPMLKWFRGTQGRITKYDASLVVDMELEVAR